MTRDAAWFETLYQSDPDPWGFETSEYERRKYDATLAALPNRRFRAALEIGCSIGVFTRLLAPICDRLLAVDVSETALSHARARCADLSQVAIERRAIPAQWPDGSYDLIVFSEVLYFLDRPAIIGAAERAAAGLVSRGCLLLVNWSGKTGTDFSGEAAADLFLASLPAGLPVTTQRHPGYRLDLCRIEQDS